MGNIVRGKILPIEGDYDPYKHRKGHSPTSKNQAFVILLKGTLGTGMLAMPIAFKYSGWLLGLIVIGIIVAFVIHGIEILIESMYFLCQRQRVPSLTYPLALETACKNGPKCFRWIRPFSGLFINGFLILNQVGVLSVYIIFMSSNIKEVIEANTNFHVDLRVHMTFYILPVILLSSIRQLKNIAIISQIANVLLLVGLAIIFYFIFDEFNPTLHDKLPFGHVLDYPNYISMTVFALETVGVMVSVADNMEKPSEFLGWMGVMSYATILAAFLYTFLGFFGYLKYGDAVKSVITLNLPPENPLAQTVRVIFSAVIFFSYAIQCYVPFEIIWYQYWQKYCKNKSREIYYQYLTKLLLVIISFILAVVIPTIGAFIGLIGAICLSSLGLTFPAIIEICILYPDRFGKYNYLLYKDIVMILIGIIVLVLGTITSVIQIIDLYKTNV